MWAPVPPEIEYTQTRPPAPRVSRRNAAAPGGSVRASAAETSSSWSRPSTRWIPYWRKTAETTASAPVRCPVCALAMELPASVRPTLTTTTGTVRLAAASAASWSVRPSLKPSM